MVKVYLPMGYPIQSGNEFSNVIYQGAVVRMYEIPKDPRTAAQVENRNFLRDFGKMRGQAGTFTRARLRSGIATTWGSILYQYAKADLDGCWSAALEEWAGFSEWGRDNWRGEAPYQATFNDKGLIFFCLLRVVYHVLTVYSFDMFGCEEWGEDDAGAAVDWFGAQTHSYATKGIYDGTTIPYYMDIAGTVTSNASARSGTYIENVGDSEFYFFGRSVAFLGRVAPGLGTLKFYLDDQEGVGYSQNYVYDTWQMSIGGAYPVGGGSRDFRGLHKVKVEVVSGVCNIDYIQVN